MGSEFSKSVAIPTSLKVSGNRGRVDQTTSRAPSSVVGLSARIGVKKQLKGSF